MKALAKSLLAVGVLCIAAPAFAQPEIVADSGDSAFVIAMSLFGLLAVLPGLTLFYGRDRAGTTGFAVLAGSALAALLFAAIGYSLIFGSGNALLGGAGNALLANLDDVAGGTTIAESVFVLFQLALALFAAAILTASVADHARPGWLLPFSGLWALLVYVPAARWVWSGWLGDQVGTLDYAGGIAVQTAAGVSALVVALLLRARGVREAQTDSRIAIAGSALAAIGWLGLIGGSALGAGDDAARAIVNAVLAISSAVLVGMAVDRLRTGRASVYSSANATLAGLAAISAGASAVGILGAVVLGALAALVSAAAGSFIERLKLGQSATAFAVHGAPAMAGAILYPLFMFSGLGGADFPEGSSMATLLAAQTIAVLAVALWAMVITVVAALMVSMLVPMKPAAEPA